MQLVPLPSPSSSENRARTRLLCDGRGLTLAVSRDGDDADVILDAGLETVNRVEAPRGLHEVLEDGDALTGGHHSDTVPRHRRGVNGTPGETDGGVGDVNKVKLSELWDVCTGHKETFK